MMFKHVGFASWTELPLRTMDMPRHYLLGQRASWLVEVRSRVPLGYRVKDCWRALALPN
jgi:hypothetical protein